MKNFLMYLFLWNALASLIISIQILLSSIFLGDFSPNNMGAVICLGCAFAITWIQLARKKESKPINIIFIFKQILYALIINIFLYSIYFYQHWH